MSRLVTMHTINGKDQSVNLGDVYDDIYIYGMKAEASATIPPGEHIHVTVAGMKASAELAGKGDVSITLGGMEATANVGDSLTVHEKNVSGMNAGIERQTTDKPTTRTSTTHQPDQIDNTSNDERGYLNYINNSQISVSGGDISVSAGSNNIEASGGEVEVSGQDGTVEASGGDAKVNTTNGSAHAAGGEVKFNRDRDDYSVTDPTVQPDEPMDAENRNGTGNSSGPSPEYITSLSDNLTNQVEHTLSASECSKYLKELHDVLIESDINGEVYQDVLDQLKRLIERVDAEQLADELDQTRVDQIQDVTHRIERLCQRRS